jgi:hypothetical protein
MVNNTVLNLKIWEDKIYVTGFNKNVNTRKDKGKLRNSYRLKKTKETWKEEGGGGGEEGSRGEEDRKKGARSIAPW